MTITFNMLDLMNVLLRPFTNLYFLGEIQLNAGLHCEHNNKNICIFKEW